MMNIASINMHFSIQIILDLTLRLCLVGRMNLRKLIWMNLN